MERVFELDGKQISEKGAFDLINDECNRLKEENKKLKEEIELKVNIIDVFKKETLKLEEDNKKLRECVGMFTDFRSEIFPHGEMIRMYGKDGCKTFICEFDQSTIKKARACLKELEK